MSNLDRGEYHIPSSPAGINLVLEGEEIYEVDGSRLRVRAGEMLLLQAGQRMRVLLEKPEGNRAICICLPDVAMPEPALVVSAGSLPLGQRLVAMHRHGDPAAILHQIAQGLPACAKTIGGRLNSIPSRRRQTRRRLLQRLERAAAHLHVETDQATSLTELADLAGMSVHHFARAFAAAYGVPPGRYRQRARIEAAGRAMEAGMSAGAAAERFGFADQASFTRAFRREVGASPVAWVRSRAPN